MTGEYGRLIVIAREGHDPPMTAKELADALGVSAPFITDVEKGRRLPSLKNQEQIKNLLVGAEFPTELFDDMAAADNDNPRVVALDIATKLREDSELRQLIRIIVANQLSAKEVLKRILGGMENG